MIKTLKIIAERAPEHKFAETFLPTINYYIFISFILSSLYLNHASPVTNNYVSFISLNNVLLIFESLGLMG
jgi:hypothetical protein